MRRVPARRVASLGDSGNCQTQAPVTPSMSAGMPTVGENDAEPLDDPT
ncbi:hypothetical protein [Pseudonocardia sp. NPDC046786]